MRLSDQDLVAKAPHHLEERFTQPDLWQWDFFESYNGLDIRFGYAVPENAIGAVIMLPGLSEFCEKYFEVARFFLPKNYAFFVLDWPGQGLSQAPSDKTHRRHSVGYDEERDVLYEFVHTYVKPKIKDLPLCMLAHSMGGLIGMYYLERYAQDIHAAAFSAPLLGMHAVRHYPVWLAHIITTYAPQTFYASGQGDWHEGLRSLEKNRIFTSDPEREVLHNKWCLSDPRLQMHGVTWGWLKETYQTTLYLQIPEILSRIETPCLIASAGKDKLVDNKKLEHTLAQLPHAKPIHFDDSFHEILVERDEIRDTFLNEVMQLFGTSHEP